MAFFLSCEDTKETKRKKLFDGQDSETYGIYENCRQG